MIRAVQTPSVFEASDEVLLYRTPDRLESVSVPIIYDLIETGGFRWARGASADSDLQPFDRTSADGATWHLYETAIYPEIWGDETTGNNPEGDTQDDVTAINQMFRYARAVSTQASTGNPTKPITMNFRGGAHYVVRSSIDATALTWTNVFIFGNGATIWGKCKDKPLVDAIGSQNMRWYDLILRGDRVDRPTYGTQIGREDADAARPGNVFSNVRHVGWFSRSSHVNSASETTKYNNCSFANRDNRRSSYTCVIDANNTMDLDTDSTAIASDQLGLELSNVTGAGNWSSNETITGGTSGATASRRERAAGDNTYITIDEITGTFLVGETITGGTSGKTATIDRISRWARIVGDQQSCTGINFEGCDFRKSDLLSQQRGTGHAIAFFTGITETGGQIKQVNFENCYSPVLDTSNIYIDGNIFNARFGIHTETQAAASRSPAQNIVIVDGNRAPVTAVTVGETLTGGTTGLTAVVTGRVDDDTDYPADQISVEVTPIETALTGTAVFTLDSDTIVGTSTLFLTELVGRATFQNDHTGEVYTVRLVVDDTHVIITNRVKFPDSDGHSMTRFIDKFQLDETITGSVSGVLGTCDSGYGPRHMIEVGSTGQTWMEHVVVTDHNPHAWQSVIAKRGTTLTMNNCELNIRATNWDVPLAQSAQASGPGGVYGNIDYHGRLNIGEGGGQQTTQLKDLSRFRRVDGIVLSEAVSATTITLPSRGDVIGIGSQTGSSTDALSFIRFSGSLTGIHRYHAAVNVESATTTDIGAQQSNRVRLTGTATITSLGTADDGVMRTVLFAGSMTLTHNATTLILPGGANIATASGDTALFISEGSGNWRCHRYQRASGKTVLINTGWTAMAGTGSKASLTAAAAGTASAGYVQAEFQSALDRIAAIEARFKSLDDALFAAGVIGT